MLKAYRNKPCVKSVPDVNDTVIISPWVRVCCLTPQKDRVEFKAGERRGVAEAPSRRVIAAGNADRIRGLGVLSCR